MRLTWATLTAAVLLGLTQTAECTLQTATGPQGAFQPLRNVPLRPAVKGPFWFSYLISPAFADHYDVCAIVELSGDAHRTKAKALDGAGKGAQADLVEFDVKVVEGAGVDSGVGRHCYAPEAFPESLPTERKRFLLLGWANAAADLLETSRPVVGSIADRSLHIKVDRACLYVGVLVPTNQEHVLAGATSAGRAYLNLVEAVSRGMDASPLRKITSQWSALGPGRCSESIEGIHAYEWIPRNLGPLLAAARKRNAVERFRLGGLVADWLKPKSTMEFLRSLPALFKELRRPENSPTVADRLSDEFFIHNLSLCYGLSPDEIVSLAMADSDLRFLALDPGLGVPSPENQQKMLSLLDDPDINTRATAYSRFAMWYGLQDWQLHSLPTFSAAQGGEIIPNEAEMHTYWFNKIGGPAKP